MNTKQPKRFMSGIPTYNAAQFRWEGKNGSQEASTLTSGGMMKLFTQVYENDRMGGFWVVSSKTGANLLFLIDDVERDEEGCVTMWVFHTERGFSITVFND